jgi:translation initiation factor IF-1
MSEQGPVEAWGIIQTHLVTSGNAWCQVLLDDGRVIDALVSKPAVRHVYQILDGDRVRVQFKDSAHPTVVELTRNPK